MFKDTGRLKIIRHLNDLEFQENAGTKVLIGVQMEWSNGKMSIRVSSTSFGKRFSAKS